MGVHSVRAIERYLEYKMRGPGKDRHDLGAIQQQRVKELFARLIHAKPSEIAFVQSTLVGENLVAAGLDLVRGGGNVVTDGLHYEGSLFLYKTLEKQGLEVRIVKPRDWRIDPADVEKVVDRQTRLVALSLVSYINGYVHQAKTVSDIAHSRGAYVYADIIQAAGAIPIDVRAMGIDFCACSGYKWLMGDRGLGYFFVREDLQGRILKSTQHGDRQFSDFSYHMFPFDPPGPFPASWKSVPGAGGHYEVGNISHSAVAAQLASLEYILGLGVENIQAHARPLTERLRKEMPRLGFECITPPGNASPILSFAVRNPDVVRAKLRRARVVVKIEWRQIRISPSVYNNDADVDRLLAALA